MKSTLHITSGDTSGGNLAKAGIPGDVFVWHDILYDGPRNPGWPDDETLSARAQFLERETGGGLSQAHVLDVLRDQYHILSRAQDYERIVLWFDACLFDQSMLVHILTCLRHYVQTAELICIDAFPGIIPYNGIGQLSPEQLASVYGQRTHVTDEQFTFAETADRAFAVQDVAGFHTIATMKDAPIAWVPAAVRRWLLEFPDAYTGLGQLERLALEAIRSGHNKPVAIFKAVAAEDTPPQYWGDTTLWAKINGLADKQLVRIDGPAGRLPQWGASDKIKGYMIIPL
ncbi:MAG: DUF1835 domain-containing protein [Spirochaetes bacterium]|nr:DUF1835 domain-containing protein [Spirochaetota bacterium]